MFIIYPECFVLQCLQACLVPYSSPDVELRCKGNNTQTNHTIPLDLFLELAPVFNINIVLQIADLGSAQTLEDARREKKIVGTYAWMAPEVSGR